MMNFTEFTKSKLRRMKRKSSNAIYGFTAGDIVLIYYGKVGETAVKESETFIQAAYDRIYQQSGASAQEPLNWVFVEETHSTIRDKTIHPILSNPDIFGCEKLRIPGGKRVVTERLRAFGLGGNELSQLEILNSLKVKQTGGNAGITEYFKFETERESCEFIHSAIQMAYCNVPLILGDSINLQLHGKLVENTEVSKKERYNLLFRLHYFLMCSVPFSGVDDILKNSDEKVLKAFTGLTKSQLTVMFDKEFVNTSDFELCVRGVSETKKYLRVTEDNNVDGREGRLRFSPLLLPINKDIVFTSRTQVAIPLIRSVPEESLKNSSQHFVDPCTKNGVVMSQLMVERAKYIDEELVSKITHGIVHSKLELLLGNYVVYGNPLHEGNISLEDGLNEHVNGSIVVTDPNWGETEVSEFSKKRETKAGGGLNRLIQTTNEILKLNPVKVITTARNGLDKSKIVGSVIYHTILREEDKSIIVHIDPLKTRTKGKIVSLTKNESEFVERIRRSKFLKMEFKRVQAAVRNKKHTFNKKTGKIKSHKNSKTGKMIVVNPQQTTPTDDFLTPYRPCRKEEKIGVCVIYGNGEILDHNKKKVSVCYAGYPYAEYHKKPIGLTPQHWYMVIEMGDDYIEKMGCKTQDEFGEYIKWLMNTDVYIKYMRKSSGNAKTSNYGIYNELPIPPKNKLGELTEENLCRILCL